MQTLPSSSRYPVVILGQGLTALSCGHHLLKLGCKDFIICGPSSQKTSSESSPGAVTGGLWGNFSRTHHAFGASLAKELWQFGHNSFDSLKNYCQHSRLSWEQGRRTRFICSPEELREAEQAVAALGQAGFSSRLLPPDFAPDATEKFFGIQDDGQRAAVCNPDELMAQLREELKDRIITKKACLLETLKDQSTSITLEKNAKAEAEILVLACHLGAIQLISGLRNILIPVADQWSEHTITSVPDPFGAWLSPGQVLSLKHGYNWLICQGEKTFAMGGGRYMRKLAGTGDATPSYEPDIEKHLAGFFSRYFPLFKDSLPGRQEAYPDIYPCDELPLIGPLPGQERVLIGTGYMNQGLSMGFFAGKCLAELIYTGESMALPRHLWPTRLRSL